jgi:hypothetical protein
LAPLNGNDRPRAQWLSDVRIRRALFFSSRRIAPASTAKIGRSLLDLGTAPGAWRVVQQTTKGGTPTALIVSASSLAVPRPLKARYTANSIGISDESDRRIRLVNIRKQP